MIIAPVVATQDSTLQNYVARLCIDGKIGTLCHTDKKDHVWYQVNFDEIFCVDMVKLILHKTDGAQFRMNNGNISVKNSDSDENGLCGILIVRDTPTTEGQTYEIECGKYICGDEIRLDVVRKGDEPTRYIAMREVTAFYSTGKIHPRTFTEIHP